MVDVAAYIIISFCYTYMLFTYTPLLVVATDATAYNLYCKQNYAVELDWNIIQMRHDIVSSENAHNYGLLKIMTFCGTSSNFLSNIE